MGVILSRLSTLNNKYRDAIIYTIRCFTDPRLIYVGSTTQCISKRFGHHRFCSKNYRRKCYQIMRDNGGIINFYIELLKDFPCDSFNELVEEEYKHIIDIGTMNSITNSFDQKQYRIDHRETIKMTKKQFYIDNKKSVLEQRKQYYIDNKKSVLEQHKQYRIDNREKIALRKKQKKVESNPYGITK